MVFKVLVSFASISILVHFQSSLLSINMINTMRKINLWRKVWLHQNLPLLKNKAGTYGRSLKIETEWEPWDNELLISWSSLLLLTQLAFLFLILGISYEYSHHSFNSEGVFISVFTIIYVPIISVFL